MATLKIIILLAALSGILVAIGYRFAGRVGVIIAFIFSTLLNIGSYWHSDQIILKMYDAKPVSSLDLPHLYAAVNNLSMRAQIPMPKVYVFESRTPNAFATGRDENHAAIVVTSGILPLLNQEELEGVISHELSHIRNKDILIGTMVATLSGTVVVLARTFRWLAYFGVGENTSGTVNLIATGIVAPVAATLIQLAISRTREYGADKAGVKLTGKPKALASALRKLSIHSQKFQLDANPATAHLFIVNPLSGNIVMNLFSTHPPIEQRIERLEQMALQ